MLKADIRASILWTGILWTGIWNLVLAGPWPPSDFRHAAKAEPPATAAADRAEESAKNGDQPFGIERRTLWTTSRFRGRPEPPPPYRARRLFPQLNFQQPTVLTSAPGTDRLFVAEHSGRIYSIPNDPECEQADLLLNVRDLVERLRERSGEQLQLEAVYGLTFHPRFAENRYCYVCYVVRYQDRGRGQHPHGTRVVRLTVSDSEPPRCDPESEVEVITWLQGGHNGGCLKFGPDGCLYISTGDGGFAFPPDGLNSGQDVSNLLSAVLRIDVDRAADGRAYAIPDDNPFVSLEGARGEIWAYGMRNPWKMSFDRETGELWVGDVGWELWELVYRVNKADNFGWSLMEGRQPVHAERQRGPTPIVPPAVEIPHTDGASVTGGFVYRGKRFPELVGTYVFGDWESRRIWGVNVEKDAVGPRRELVEPTVRIVGFAEDEAGELYLLDYDDGTIHELVRNDVAQPQHPFPRTLTETGIFRSVDRHEVADGVLSFSINSPQWSDHAHAQRFLGVPGDGSIALHAEPQRVEGSMFSRGMDFPTDTVLLKTLSLDLVAGDPASRRRIETQVLHFDGRDWRGYTYAWNDDQSDAELVAAEGMNRDLRIEDPAAPDGSRGYTWRYASRTECIRCHNPWSEHTLAFNVAQLNRPHDYGSVTDNQLRTLRHVGVLRDIVEPTEPGDPLAHRNRPPAASELPRLADPRDEAADLNARARSYLHVNCAHCHRNGGGGSAYLHLPHDVDLEQTKAVGNRPTQGTFGIHDAEIVGVGDPYRSVLYYRMATPGPGHMPHLGARLVDERGLALIHDWIRQLPVRGETDGKIARLIDLEEPAVLAREQAEAPRVRWRLARSIAAGDGRETPSDADYEQADRQAAAEAGERAARRAAERERLIQELLETPASALMLVRAVRQERLPNGIRQAAIAAAARVEDLATRDLFEPFLPEELRARRLGEVISVGEILELEGDVERGRQLFHQSANSLCRNCHAIGGQGNHVGPDLSRIGKKYDRAKLLESILEPSKNIDPQYVSWLVERVDGKVLTGLLVRKDDEQVVIRDARNQEHRLPREEIDGMYPQRKSLMPELLLRDLTARQAADLLAYLASLRD